MVVKQVHCSFAEKALYLVLGHPIFDTCNLANDSNGLELVSEKPHTVCVLSVSFTLVLLLIMPIDLLSFLPLSSLF